ncbi:glycosyltransferase family 4 protein [Streptomyces lydicamycinicus]|uniref:D-inositol 3-phosphate glycosyltransferase n=1 Tax=Streptomyces lydicamycinicus TaxID=1546107 RepID=A0A0P4RCM5_9ACTN|nr:glycosyltransferase family 4 protein [Streptomyces lydicamycinicus]URZ99753.1 glycosyltransferase family 4 protein [Streptomyces lydicamycinicus]GAO10833.1 putative glycosyltransferase [Streptomyces lydicamycinicus]
MRILHVHWTGSPVTGGVETHLRAVVGQLGALPCEVRAVVGTPRSPDCDYDAALDIEVPFAPDGAAALTERCLSADVVHWHNPQWHKPEVVTALVARLRDRRWPGRFVFDLHNIDERPERWEFLAALPGPLAVHSDFVAGEVRRRLPAAEVITLPLALPLCEAPFRLPGGAGGTTVLQPTRMTRWKGSHLSLEASLTLLDEGADLHFVHAGTQHLIWPPGIPDTLLERAGVWQEKGRVHFTHYRPEQSWAAIRASDIVIHPTIDRGAHGEPFSLSVAQAVICGRRIIASDSGNLPLLLADYSAATLVPAGDVRALTEALREAVDRPAVAPTTADRALAQHLRDGFATAGRHHLAFYRTLAGPT